MIWHRRLSAANLPRNIACNTATVQNYTAGPSNPTYTILTTAANAEMSTLHDRIPLVLERNARPAWLGEVEADPKELLRPAPDGTLHTWAVSKAVNSVRNNEPQLVDRIDDPTASPASDAPAGRNPE